jgi:hypothetical protein
MTLFIPSPPGAPPEAQPTPFAISTLRYADGRYLAEMPEPPHAGDYRVEFEATLEGKLLSDETHYVIEATEVELLNRLANFQVLADLARPGAKKGMATFHKSGGEGGGQIYRLDSFGELLDQFKASEYLIRREKPQSTDLGDAYRWPLLILAILLLTAEWVIRKLKNLV